ncbi:peptidyl-tRNA hydrolase, mitochondrial isoform X2 [Cryptomeria japonica]|uniref:peptidyl-tRNA hydrolase, mitochondrial isoform X2 n=1 Tax=Cryptomeria japonica TaxID=3369 RepID=UPI0027DA2D72|nr:peptidyl-tRNA hydrolase, mitochondrial isoform X2 [Cryptomeria japonica]
MLGLVAACCCSRLSILMPVIPFRYMVSGLSQLHGPSLPIIRDGSSYNRPSPWLLVGLGNPGPKYEGTRHNVGFEMIDYIAQAENISIHLIHCKALCGKGHIGNVPVLLAKPQTYMDLSGESVGPLAAYHRIRLHHVLLMFDDMSLPCGVLRLCPRGGHGCHNGVRSVIKGFKQNENFARLRIGIGKPPRKVDPKAYVLEVFNISAREMVNSALKEGVEAVKLFTSEGFFESVNRFNIMQKYKHQKIDYLDIGKIHDSGGG